jgi:hypothetical protein
LTKWHFSIAIEFSPCAILKPIRIVQIWKLEGGDR